MSTTVMERQVNFDNLQKGSENSSKSKEQQQMRISRKGSKIFEWSTPRKLRNL